MQKRFHLDLRGGPLEKAKIKIEQGKQEKKIRAPEKFEKKFVQRLNHNRENYKLTGPIRGTV
jgi:hypothetical protein